MRGGLKPLGLAAAVIGAALIGYAVFLGFETDCAPLDNACQEARAPAIIAFPVGLGLTILSTFIGGGLSGIVFMLLAMGLGSLASVAFADKGEWETFYWIFGGIFTFVGLVAVTLWLVAHSRLAARVVKATRLMESGVKAIGTVTEVRDTGITINENPRIDIVMRVEPVDGSPAVERRKRITAPRVALPRVGDRYPVWFDRDDPESWVFVTDVQEGAPAAVREMFARAKAPAPARESDPIAELERLSELRREGALTDEEFAEAKARLVDRIGR